MASTFITVPKPFLALPFKANATSLQHHKSLLKFRRNSLQINAVSTKWEPAKVAPQADRVLVRLEVLAEVDLGTDAKHCFCKESDLLAIVQ